MGAREGDRGARGGFMVAKVREGEGEPRGLRSRDEWVWEQ